MSDCCSVVLSKPMHDVGESSVIVFVLQEFRVLLTGTPLQNNVEELFSLLNFLEPAKFPILSTFMEKFGDLKTEEQVEQLKEVIRLIV